MNEVVFLKKSLAGRGGLENQTFRIAQGFQERGYKVTCLTSGTIDPYFQDLRCVCFPVKSRMNFLKVLEFDRNCQDYLKQYPAKIVFGMERNSFQTHLRLGNGIHRAYLDHIRKFEGMGKKLSHLFNPAPTSSAHSFTLAQNGQTLHTVKTANLQWRQSTIPSESMDYRV